MEIATIVDLYTLSTLGSMMSLTSDGVIRGRWSFNFFFSTTVLQDKG